MRKMNIERLVVEARDDDDGDMIETSLSDDEVSKLEAGIRIQSELADIKYHFRPKPTEPTNPRGSYQGAGKGNEYSGRGKEE